MSSGRNQEEARRVNRRSILKGAAVGGIVPATYVGTRRFGSEETAAEATTERTTSAKPDAEETDADEDKTAVSIRIVDVPDAIPGGAFLKWSVEVTNPTDQPVRPTLEYAVDGESAGSVTLTVDPGETERPFPVSVPTEPVAEDRPLEIHVETETDVDTATVTLLGVDELAPDLLFPDRELRVRPGTTVHFEVGAVDPETPQTTSWWVDSENVGDSLGAWQATYFADQGAHYWQETFDEPGTYEVAASVAVDDERYRASWTVEVAETRPEGLADPVIEAGRPAPGVLEVGPDEAVDLEIDVADPDGNLDRVVWWLTQADTILGVSEVSGEWDTATLSVDGGLCHTCAIIPWVITGDGTFTDAPVWVVDHPGLESPELGDDIGLGDEHGFGR